MSKRSSQRQIATVKRLLLRQVVDWDLRGLSLPDLVKFLAGRIPYPPALILTLLMVYRLLMP